MSKRKTVNVEAMLEQFNNILASSQVPQESKVGISTAAELLLFQANRYAGFRYLNLTRDDETGYYNTDPGTEYNRVYFAKKVR